MIGDETMPNHDELRQFVSDMNLSNIVFCSPTIVECEPITLHREGDDEICQSKLTLVKRRED